MPAADDQREHEGKDRETFNDRRRRERQAEDLGLLLGTIDRGGDRPALPDAAIEQREAGKKPDPEQAAGILGVTSRLSVNMMTMP